jgi:hypothetical protein
MDSEHPSEYQGYNCIADDPVPGRYALWMLEVK